MTGVAKVVKAVKEDLYAENQIKNKKIKKMLYIYIFVWYDVKKYK